MIQRIALLIGGLGAALVLAFALGLVNFAVAWPWNTANTANVTTAADSQAVAQADNGAANAAQNAQPQTKTVVSKVYVAPAPPAKANHAASSAGNQPAAQPAAPRAPRASNNGGYYSESESEGGSGGHHGGDD